MGCRYGAHPRNASKPQMTWSGTNHPFPSKESAGAVNLSITRQGGAEGEVRLKWRTRDKTAVSGKDYIGGEGEVAFDQGETQRSLSILIIEDSLNEHYEEFEVELYEADNNAKLGKQAKIMVAIDDT